MRWLRLLATNPLLKKNNRLKKYVRKGVPLPLRKQVWPKTREQPPFRKRVTCTRIIKVLLFASGVDVRWWCAKAERQSQPQPVPTAVEQAN